MTSFRNRDLLDQAFLVGIVLKGFDGVLEVVGGVLLLVITPTTIDRVTRWLTQHELSEDPHDFIATHVLHAAGKLTTGSLRFGAVYLLLHGAVKIVLVTALLQNKLWAYPWTIAFLLAFIGYQVYRLTFGLSIALLGLTIFDAIVVWLVWREYLKQRELARRRRMRWA